MKNGSLWLSALSLVLKRVIRNIRFDTNLTSAQIWSHSQQPLSLARSHVVTARLPGHQRRPQEVTVPSQEIVLHITRPKTATWFFFVVQIKQTRYKVLISSLKRQSHASFSPLFPVFMLSYDNLLAVASNTKCWTIPLSSELIRYPIEVSERTSWDGGHKLTKGCFHQNHHLS